MKNTLLTALFICCVWPAFGQNKQWLRNMDSTVSRVYNLYYGTNSNQYYSITWHKDFRGSINNNLSYYKFNQFDKDTLTQSTPILKIDKRVFLFNNSMINRNEKHAILFKTNFQEDTAVNYIFYFNDTLRIDSFNIQSPIPMIGGFCYMKQNDSLIIIHADDFIVGGNVYILFTDSQGRYLSHKRIPHENDNPNPDFNNIVMNPINMIADGKGGYIVVGERDSIGTNTKKHLFGLNHQGEKTWEYVEPLAGNSYLTGVKLLPDGNLLTWGMQWDRMYIGTFTNTGVPIWQNMYYPGYTPDNATFAVIKDVQIIDNHLYVVGTSGENMLGVNPYTMIGVLMKLTLQGDVVWAKGFGNYYDNNILEHMLFMPPNKFMLGGFCMDSTLNPVHGVAWYVSTDTAANQELPWCRLLSVATLNYTGLNDIQNQQCIDCITVFPNPVSNEGLTLEVNSAYQEEAEVVLYSYSGIPVFKQTNLITKQTIDTRNLPSGNYILWFNSKKGKTTKKIVIR